MGQRRGHSRRDYRRVNRRKQRNRRLMLFGLVLLGIIFAAGVIKIVTGKVEDARLDKLEAQVTQENGSFIGAPPFEVNLLDVNEYSRPGIPLKKIKGIVVHYTANPGSTAAENRNYFEGLKDSHETKVSSHFVIGIEGEIVQCIPSSEIAYASNSRNDDTLSIECCHKDETGEFTEATYDSLVKLVGWLCYRFGLESSDVIRHYDVTEKICPKYFVDHPDAWEQFKKDVDGQILVVAEEVKVADSKTE
ncbi:N-acetylmuramoyl-L-alanine amidase family protein [Blautia marasmi]|uniref:peptidoglycan recognition protein family protein n=1 Tax=Blautia marasmi TaxID=1917868 RepID=UPI00266B99F7|nr:peptidoglycan recognition family protein [Blautia marasmi]